MDRLQKCRAVKINTKTIEAGFLEHCLNVYNKLKSLNTGYLYPQLEKVLENKNSVIRELLYYTKIYNMFNKRIPNKRAFWKLKSNLSTNDYMKFLFKYNNLDSSNQKKIYFIKCYIKTIL